MDNVILGKPNKEWKDEIYYIYTQHGQAAAFDYCNKFSIPYEYCKACETESPSLDHECCICGTPTTLIKKMNNTINVSEILAKKIIKFPEEGLMTDEAIKRNVKAAIKEIVERLLKLVEQEMILDRHFPGKIGEVAYEASYTLPYKEDSDCTLVVSSYFADKIKTLIKYE